LRLWQIFNFETASLDQAIKATRPELAGMKPADDRSQLLPWNFAPN
jgi:hypothetical protein